MTFEAALRQRLKNASGVTALVQDRIFWSVRAQSTGFPAIVLMVVSDARPQNMDGFDRFWPTRVQVDTFGKERSEAAATREAVIAALIGPAQVGGVSFLRATVNNVLDRGDDESGTFIHRDLIDLTIWHN